MIRYVRYKLHKRVAPGRKKCKRHQDYFTNRRKILPKANKKNEL